MKPRGKGGVVDSRLNVYGVQGLKVVGTCNVEFIGALGLTSVRPFHPSVERCIGKSSAFGQTMHPLTIATQNTHSTALVVAEKAAVIIAEDLGIQGV